MATKIEIIDDPLYPDMLDENGKPLYGGDDEYDVKELLATSLKGGPGSGHFNHAGRPGKVGGSSSSDDAATSLSSDSARDTVARIRHRVARDRASSKREPKEKKIEPKKQAVFDVTRWTTLAPKDRDAAWSAEHSEEERDLQTNAKRSIPSAIRTITRSMGPRPSYDGDIQGAIKARMGQAKELVTPLANEMITKAAIELDGLLERAGAKPRARHRMAMEVADALVAQEYEAMSRQLGDHGIRHIIGNIQTAMMVMDEVPGYDTPRQKAAAYIGMVFHDTGYFTEPSRNFMDAGHARWGAEHYDANVRALASEVIGERWARKVTGMIADHAGTEVDWKEDVVGSAVRLADNTAVFHREKLPGLFQYVNGTTSILFDLHHKRIDIGQAKKQMAEKVAASKHPERVKKALMKAVNEVFPLTGQFTLGMLGGHTEGVKWTGSHIKVKIKRNRSKDLENKLLDLGQRQMAKFVKSYKLPPDKFLSTGSEVLKHPRSGEVVLEFEMS